MLQNINWMRYLTLGISILALNSSLSCKSDIDYAVIGDYLYVNSTDTLIRVTGIDTFIINPKESHFISVFGDGSEYVTEKNYVPPLIDGVIIYYNDTLCDALQPGPRVGEGEGIIGIQNYKSEKIANRHYKFTYTFTQADVEKAAPCN